MYKVRAIYLSAPLSILIFFSPSIVFRNCSASSFTSSENSWNVVGFFNTYFLNHRELRISMKYALHFELHSVHFLVISIIKPITANINESITIKILNLQEMCLEYLISD